MSRKFVALVPLVVVFLALPAAAWGNTCSGFVIDQVTHNTIRVSFKNDELTSQAQIQYGPTSRYGSTQGDVATRNVPGGMSRIMTLTGIAPNTTYHFAAQSFTGSAWCAAVDQTATTLNSPAHPILPAPPETFSVSAPAKATGVIHAVAPLTCATLYPHGFTAATWGGRSCRDEVDLQRAIRTSPGSGACNATYGDLILLNPGSVYGYSGANPGATLTLCDAPDASNHISSFAAATGIWTTTSAHGLHVGDRVILGYGYIGDNFAGSNDHLPTPFNPGYSYYVQSVPTPTTFTVSNTSGGALVTGLAGTDFTAPAYGCFVKGTDVPAESEIVIRSATPDSQLPPFGVSVFTDAKMNVTSPSVFATIRTSGVTSPAVRFDMGCLAHHYRFMGIKWDYKPVGSVNELDGESYSQFLNSSAGNSHITLDRNWVHGGSYPERDFKWCIVCDGHYMAFLNNVFDGLNFWTPSWSFSPVLTNGSTITLRAGHIYFGNGVSDKLELAAGGTLKIISGGGVAGSAVLEADRGGVYLTVPAGVTATCSIAGLTCTVNTSPAPAYASKDGVYTRVAIAKPSIANGAWTAINENSPPFLSLPGQANSQEGSAVIAINKGPGPYLVKGNLFHNTPGIAFYLTSDYAGMVNPLNGGCAAAGVRGCPWINGPADLVFSQNTFKIDAEYLANESNPAWTGRFYSMRQHFEFKAGQRTRVVGNVFDGAFCNNYSGRGVNIAFAVHGSHLTMTSSDHEVAFNTFRNACQGFQFVGGNGSGGSAPGDNPINSQRIWFHDNTVTQIDRYKMTTFNTFGAPGDNGTVISLNMGPQDVTFEHNFFDVNKGSSPANNFVCNRVEGLTFRNNIVGYSNDDGLNGWWYSGCGGSPDATRITGGELIPIMVPHNLIWNNNVMFGGYSNSQKGTQMNSREIAAQQGLWKNLPTTTFAAGNTIAARAATIGFEGYDVGAFQLRSDSPYAIGGASRASDGLDLGPDTRQQCVQQGCVQNVRSGAISATSATVSFTAPDATGCPVDLSTNELATFTRTNNTGGSREQEVTLSGLTAATKYTYRINCAVQQPVRTFTTTP